MMKSRFSAEQKVKMVRETEQRPVAEVAKKARGEHRDPLPVAAGVRRHGAPRALARDARTIEQLSRWWPRQKAPRPENAIKTRAAVCLCVFEVFHIARAAVRWRTAPKKWRPPPCEHVCPCSPTSPAANKPKALSAASGD